MPDDADLSLLACLQLGDSFLPTGAYTVSQGLESMVQAGWVSNARDLERMLIAYLRGQLAPADGVALANAHRASARGDLSRLVTIDLHLDALKLAREPRESSRRMGLNVLKAIGPTTQDALLSAYTLAVNEERTPGHHAVVLGTLARALGLSTRDSLLAYLHSSTVSMLGAALRLMRVDHVTVQLALARLRPTLAALASEHEDRPWQSMRAFAPQLEIAAMVHERARVRLFSS